MRAPRSPAVFDEWAGAIEAVMEGVWLAAALVGAAAVLAVVAASEADHLADTRSTGRCRPRWGRRRAIRSFAAAVCGGDLDAAERAAGRLLERNDAGARAPRGQRSAWEESVVLACPWSSAIAEVRSLEAIARRFPAPRRVGDGATEVFVGKHDRVRLRILAEWVVPGGGACFVADAGGTVLTGHLVLRPLATHSGVAGSGVEVRVDVHAAGRGSRRALRATRSVTRAGLRRWAAELTAT